jgi:hypothetical protein
MTARSRRPPLIFQADEIPQARSDSALVGFHKQGSLPGSNDSSELNPRSASTSDPSVVEPPPRVNRVNSVNSGETGETPTGSAKVGAKKKATTITDARDGSKTLNAALVEKEMTFREVVESPERVQIGPRIHPSYKVFLEDLFHPIRHQSDGGMQTMIMACLEVVRRDPKLQRQAQSWASEAEPEQTDVDSLS